MCDPVSATMAVIGAASTATSMAMQKKQQKKANAAISAATSQVSNTPAQNVTKSVEKTASTLKDSVSQPKRTLSSLKIPTKTQSTLNTGGDTNT